MNGTGATAVGVLGAAVGAAALPVGGMMYQLFAVMAALLLALPIGGATAVQAQDTTTFTQPFSGSDCFDYPPGYQACTQLRGVFHSTQTTSGNTIYVGNGQMCHTVSQYGTMISQQCDRSQAQSLSMDGLLQELSQQLRGSDTYQVSATGYVTCTYAYALHVANGQTLFQRSFVNCAPV